MMWIRINQRLADKTKKKICPKKGIPPWAQVWGNLYIYYQDILDTDFIMYQKSQSTIRKKRWYKFVGGA